MQKQYAFTHTKKSLVWACGIPQIIMGHDDPPSMIIPTKNLSLVESIIHKSSINARLSR